MALGVLVGRMVAVLAVASSVPVVVPTAVVIVVMHICSLVAF